MSQLSQTILEHMVDYSLAAQRRIANYQALLEALSEFAIFREIDLGVKLGSREQGLGEVQDIGNEGVGVSPPGDVVEHQACEQRSIHGYRG